MPHLPKGKKKERIIRPELKHVAGLWDLGNKKKDFKNPLTSDTDLYLEFFRQYVCTFISDYDQMTQSLEVIIRQSAEKLGKELFALVTLPLEPLKEVEDYATFRTPNTWFQHLKQSHSPQWFLKRFPVRWHEEKVRIVLKVGAVCPQLPRVFPKNVGVIRYSYKANSPVSTYPNTKD